MTDQVNKWEEELAAAAVASSAALPTVGGDWLSTKGGKLSCDGTDVPGSTMQAIILDFLNENQFYDTIYDPANPAGPCCYAFGSDKDAMCPHAKVETPVAKACKGCPNLEWGSADRGKGKACREVLRLALIPAVEAKDVADAPIKLLKVPVMSVKNFTAFASQLAKVAKRPPFAAITEIKVTSENQVTIHFKTQEIIQDGELIAAIMEKRKEVELDFPYPEMAQAEEKPAKPARGAARFGGARR